jgi:membrane associated rhomboid family serine protease
MGSTNRDYMRDEPGSGTPTWGHDVPTTKWLIIVTVGTFFLQTLLTQPGHFYLEEWLCLWSDEVLHGQIWRLVTFVFCHDRGAPFSLVFNMVALWYLGSAIERMYGSREFLWFYLFSALVCGLVFTAFGLQMKLPMPLMGAGACVLATLTLYATHFPNREILFAWVIPMQIWALLLIYVAVDAYQIVQASAGQAPWARVAYMSELWGMAFGYLYRTQNWHLASFGSVFDLGRWRKTMRRATTARTLKVFHPESKGSLEEQVDAILAKIHEQGSESLTDRERAILQRASAQAKNRL